MGMKLRMQWKPGHGPVEAAKNLEKYFLIEKKAELEAALLAMLPEITAWMKENAPWEDRTGKARESLRAEFSRRAKVYVVLHFRYGDNIDYATYLENMQAGRFSILPKTMDYWQPRIFDAIKRVMGAR
jgi:hypothetical protein